MENQQTTFGKLQKPALLLGVIGLAASGFGFVSDHDQFAQSYLVSYVYWLALACGSLGMLMLHHMVNGRWGFVVQRPLEAAAKTIPLMALLFIPILLSIHELYHWSHEDVMATDHLLQLKAAYLNTNGFIIRAVVYFALYLVMLTLLIKKSNGLDTTEDMEIVHRTRVVAAPGLLVFTLVTSFAAFDWLMSLEPHWFSSIYGALFMVGQGLSTFAFMAIVACKLGKQAPMKQVITAQQYHDLGNFLFAFTILWTYMSFSQFIIIWSGNLYEGTAWYMQRSNMDGRNWLFMSYILFGVNFVLPFLFLLFRGNKRNPNRLVIFGFWVLIARIFEYYWLVAPTFRDSALDLHWLDAATFVGVGGLWLAAFVTLLNKKPLLIKHDPRFSAFAAGGDTGHHA